MRKNLLTALLTIAATLACVPTASAAVIALDNPGFETDTISTNGFVNAVPTGWILAFGAGQYMANGSAFGPDLNGGHLSSQYYLAANGASEAIRQDTSLQWSSLSVGDTLTLSAWTSYRDTSGTYPNAPIAYFWLNDNNASGINSGGINVTTDGLLGGGSDVAPGVWVQRSWTYTVTAGDLANANGATPWGAVDIQLGIALSSGTRQVAFDDVTLTYTPVAVPEPSSLALCGAGLGALMLRRKRRA